MYVWDHPDLETKDWGPSETQRSETQGHPDNSCYHCGGTNHKPSDYKFKEYCRRCDMKGHIARVCRSKTKRCVIKAVEEETEVDYKEPLNILLESPSGRIPPLKIQVLVDGCEVPMEIDTGASRSIRSESLFRSIWPKRKLSTSSLN